MAPRYLAGGNAAITANILGSIADKEKRYMEPLQKSHVNVKNLATTLQRMQNELPALLDGVMSTEELNAFFAESKAAIQQLAEKNVERQREVRDFVGAIKTVQAGALQGNYEEDTDYKQAIATALVETKERAAQRDVDVHQEKYYRDVMESLGETGQDDEDDEIACVTTGGTQGNSLKCPITGVLLQDPVKNKICGHSYSRQGIQSHIRTKGRACKCPVPGCMNQRMLGEADLEDDLEAERAVRHEKQRLQAQEKRNASQADDVDSDDDDEE